MSNGVPRVVNQVCDLALEIGQEHQTRVVDARIVRAAARRLHMERDSRQWPWRMTAAATAVFTLVGARSHGVDEPFAAGAGRGRAHAATGHAARGPASAADRLSLRRSPADAACGTLASASSITVTVGSFKSADRAAAVAAQIQGLALPAFTRVRDGQWHQVVVGPYLTTEEATAAQRGLRLTDSRHPTLVEQPQ